MIEPISDVHLVSQAIRDAVAPVFLLTGIGSMLAVLVGRLARAIDRARFINENGLERLVCENELALTVARIKWLRRAIGFATLAALLICISIMSMFLLVEGGFNVSHIVVLSFIATMVFIIMALLCFLREILLAAKETIDASIKP